MADQPTDEELLEMLADAMEGDHPFSTTTLNTEED